LEDEVSCAGRVELLQAAQHNMRNKQQDAVGFIDYGYLRLKKYMKEKFKLNSFDLPCSPCHPLSWTPPTE
jgi:hypothetical protein